MNDLTDVVLLSPVKGPASLFTEITFPGHGPVQPGTLGLGFTITSHARELKATADSLPVTLTLDDSVVLTPGPLHIGNLDASGTFPTLQVTVFLTRASLMALAHSNKAVLAWPKTTIRLGAAEVGGVRALYRALLCAPQGIVVQGSPWP